MKYFEKQDDLSGFQIRTGILGMELRKITGPDVRGYVIVGNDGYHKRLTIMKTDYSESYDDFKIDYEFDNQSDRAGFFWHGKSLTK